MKMNGWATTANYRFGDNNKLQAGVTYKDKNRDYMGTRFYYNLNKLNPVITDIYNTDSFLNMENCRRFKSP